MLALARAAIADAFGGGAEADASAPWLREPGASFVTLKQGGELRGCIGSLEARRPLLDDVAANARAAAFRDPRFPPLDASEFELTRIEISLLSALEPVPARSETEALDRIRPQVDGLVLNWDAIAEPFCRRSGRIFPIRATFSPISSERPGCPTISGRKTCACSAIMSSNGASPKRGRAAS